MLGLGMLAQTAGAVFINGAAFLIPALHDDLGLSFATAGILVAMPTVGIMLTLIAWGVLVDRVGERLVLAIGLGLTALASVAAYFTTSLPILGLCLLVGGMAAASANSASGRVVVGWFPPKQRGLAMGIRQMSVPLGVAVAAMTIPSIARDHGVGSALLVPAVICGLGAILCLGVVDPPRPDRAAAEKQGLLVNPYRTSSQLWRIHSTSILLVVPQYVVWTYALVWLMSDRGWSAASAGVLVTATQILGALGRMGVGALSDRVGSRMRPLRWVAVSTTVTMLVLAITDWMDSPVSIVVMVVASVVTVAPNGLAFTAVAEFAGPYWSGRALGMQNTGQYIAASLVPPAFGALAAVSFPVAFLVSSIFPALSVPVIPADHESKD
ncbi:MFS transporter [Rhodococcus sp. BP-252]|uniref:MFS transporter n=1 Tax=Rhodococcoides kyotonense TaxID=398843 RepID=A0A177YAY6_9NOCA|nr:MULTISPECIES: MFS transporter [Rhodococcus]MBY6411181.1 MFS transporter [Rhodococcus sp. BP-320]MBY6415840.1 MFS transporter [Rhodococcus sp. BP-321]MBY6423664.1 MFS transporter [Rhodococcus sp. BP-324]MBY6425833.1 MFS transporter [Rhodococcus sp. BP-323]MBY6431046.1 MFS transporter [Rhodococcus sp. BP-322]